MTDKDDFRKAMERRPRDPDDVDADMVDGIEEPDQKVPQHGERSPDDIDTDDEIEREQHDEEAQHRQSKNEPAE